jgi:hypothetical protein
MKVATFWDVGTVYSSRWAIILIKETINSFETSAIIYYPAWCWCGFTDHISHFEIQRQATLFHCRYSPRITSWSPQGMRVLRQSKVPRAKVIFVTIQRENIRPSKKEWTRLLQFLNCPMFAVRLWITTSPCRWPIRSLPTTYMLCTSPSLRTFTPRRVQLVICG